MDQVTSVMAGDVQEEQTSQSQPSQSSQDVNPRKLFVGNLSWNLTSEDLRQIFSEFGAVEDAVVLTDKFSGRSKGFGFVTMASEEEAQAAIEGLHQKDVDGRSIVVNVAQPPRPREERRFGGGNRGGDRGGFRGGDRGGDRGGFRRNNDRGGFRRGGSNRDY